MAAGLAQVPGAAAHASASAPSHRVHRLACSGNAPQLGTPVFRILVITRPQGDHPARASPGRAAARGSASRFTLIAP